MNINRAGKENHAYWRSEQRHRELWEKEKPIVAHDKAYGQYQITVQRLQGFAAGWIAASNWVKRQKRA